MTIKEILATGANFQLVVNAVDLKEFALSIINECRKDAETKAEPEKYLSRFEVAEMLGVSTNALWRWQQQGYLVPNKVGHKSVYPLSRVKSLLDGKNEDVKDLYTKKN